MTNDSRFIHELLLIESNLPDHNKYYKTEVDYFSKYQVQLYNKYYIFNNLTYADKLKQQAIYLESRIISKFDVSYCKKISLGMDMLDLNIEKRREKADYAADLFLQNNHNIKIHEPLYGSVFWRLNLFILDTRNKILEEILHQSLPIGSWFPPVDLFFEGKRSVDDIMPVSDKIGDQILNVLVNDQVDRSYYDKLNTIFIQNEE